MFWSVLFLFTVPSLFFLFFFCLHFLQVGGLSKDRQHFKAPSPNIIQPSSILTALYSATEGTRAWLFLTFKELAEKKQVLFKCILPDEMKVCLDSVNYYYQGFPFLLIACCSNSLWKWLSLAVSNNKNTPLISEKKYYLLRRSIDGQTMAFCYQPDWTPVDHMSSQGPLENLYKRSPQEPMEWGQNFKQPYS